MAKREYSEEFKRAAVARIVAGEQALAVSRDIGIDSNSLIYAWRDKYAADIKRSAKAAASIAPGVLITTTPSKGPGGRTIYPIALKQQCVALVNISKLSYDDAAAQTGVPKDRIEKWVRTGIKRGARGDLVKSKVMGKAGPPVPAAPAQVVVAQPTRQHRGPSPYSNKDTRQYLLMMEQSLIQGIREGRIKNLREHPELILSLNALAASEVTE